MIHGPHGWQLELLKGAEKDQMGLDVIGASHPGAASKSHFEDAALAGSFCENGAWAPSMDSIVCA